MKINKNVITLGLTHKDWHLFSHLVFFAYKSLNFAPTLYSSLSLSNRLFTHFSLSSLVRKKKTKMKRKNRVFQICPFVDKNSIYFQSLHRQTRK